MSKHDYNIAVIGAGSAGLVTSYIAAAIKAKTVLFEKHKMGGDCLNTGCVPSKALIKTTKTIANFKKAPLLGLKDISYTVDFAEVMEQVQKVIKTIEPHDSVERYTSLGVECIQGEARLISPEEIMCDGKTYSAKNIIIATGARPRVFPIPGLDAIDYLHSDNIWNLRELPKRMLFVGGGPIGCELAQCFQRLGSEVTIIDMAPTLLNREDPEIAQYVIRSFEKDGIKFIGGASLLEFSQTATGGSLRYKKDDREENIEFDRVFLGMGRQANTANLGLEHLGIELNPAGTIKVDSYLRTYKNNIFACGDVAGPYQFTHTAAHQAWYCAVNALFGPFKKFKVDYSVIPWVTFTDPEVAHVGMNEIMVEAAGVDFEVTRYGLDDLDRAIADREDEGLIKVITRKGKDTILGATIVGSHADDMIGEFILAMKHNIGLNKILGTIHPYPTFIEGNKYVAGNWKREHAPQKILNFLESFHQMRL